MLTTLDPPGSRHKKCLSAGTFAGYSGLGSVSDFPTSYHNDTIIGGACQSPSQKNSDESARYGSNRRKYASGFFSAAGGSQTPSEGCSSNLGQSGAFSDVLTVDEGIADETDSGGPGVSREPEPFSASPYLIIEHKSHTRDLTRVYERFSEVGHNADLQTKISRFSEAKLANIEQAEFLREIDADRAGKLDYCGSFLWLRDYYEQDVARVKGGMFCGQPRLCQACAIRRSAKLLQSVTSKISHVVVTENLGGFPLLPYLVTFTVKDGPDLLERYRHLDGAIRSMAAHARNSRSSCRNIPNQWSKAAGVFVSYEFKRGSGSGLWHPHAHAIFLSDTMPDMYAFREEWKRITGDSFIVDVRSLDCNEKLREGFANIAAGETPMTPEIFDDVSEMMVGDLVEVCKYTLKLSGMAPADCWAAFQSLFGLRMVRTYGNLYGVQVSESGDDNESDLQGPYVDYVLRWMKKSQFYYLLRFLTSAASSKRRAL